MLERICKICKLCCFSNRAAVKWQVPKGLVILRGPPGFLKSDILPFFAFPLPNWHNIWTRGPTRRRLGARNFCRRPCWQVMLKKYIQQHRQYDHGRNKLTPVEQQKPSANSSGWQKELMAIIEHKEHSDILSAEWLDEDDADLSDLSFQQIDGNDESITMPIVTIEEYLTFLWEDDGKWH